MNDSFYYYSFATKAKSKSKSKSSTTHTNTLSQIQAKNPGKLVVVDPGKTTTHTHTKTIASHEKASKVHSQLANNHAKLAIHHKQKSQTAPDPTTANIHATAAVNNQLAANNHAKASKHHKNIANNLKSITSPSPSSSSVNTKNTTTTTHPNNKGSSSITSSMQKPSGTNNSKLPSQPIVNTALPSSSNTTTTGQNLVGIQHMKDPNWAKGNKYTSAQKMMGQGTNSAFITTDTDTPKPVGLKTILPTTGRKIPGSAFEIDANNKYKMGHDLPRPSYRFVCAEGCNVPFKNVEATTYVHVGPKKVLAADNQEGRIVLGTGGGPQSNVKDSSGIYSLGFTLEGKPFAEQEGSHVGGAHITGMKNTVDGQKPNINIGPVTGKVIGLKTAVFHKTASDGNKHTYVQGFVDKDNNGQWQKFYSAVDPSAPGAKILSSPFVAGKENVQEVRTRVENHPDTQFDASRTEAREINPDLIPDSSLPPLSTATTGMGPDPDPAPAPTPTSSSYAHAYSFGGFEQDNKDDDDLFLIAIGISMVSILIYYL